MVENRDERFIPTEAEGIEIGRKIMKAADEADVIIYAESGRHKLQDAGNLVAPGLSGSRAIDIRSYETKETKDAGAGE
jgi:hypothetical protein